MTVDVMDIVFFFIIINPPLPLLLETDIAEKGITDKN
jgi:hypothetical protein